MVKFGYTKFADFFDNDRQTFDQLSATFRQFKNWPNWIVSTSGMSTELHCTMVRNLWKKLGNKYNFPWLLSRMESTSSIKNNTSVISQFQTRRASQVSTGNSDPFTKWIYSRNGFTRAIFCLKIIPGSQKIWKPSCSYRS